MIVTYKYRIKDSSAAARHLNRHAIACNRVWNYCVAIQREAERRYRGGSRARWPTAFDLINLTAGTSSELGINADTINVLCQQFARSRDQHKHCPRFRKSFGARRSLGWVPFRRQSICLQDGAATYRKARFRYWASRPVEGIIKTGAFVQDARGRWYLTIQCKVEDNLPTGAGEIGIDLGLKALATCSDGRTVPALQHYRQYEAALATAQRARNKRRVRAIHAKIANARRHQLHVASTELARENRLIVVGNVSPTKLAKTRMAKSVLDAGWSDFRHMLRYKLARRQAVYVEADERNTSRTCSACGSIPTSSPKGMGALGIRRWECSDCGAVHDRDVNAAINILRVGLERQVPVEDALAA